MKKSLNGIQFSYLPPDWTDEAFDTRDDPEDHTVEAHINDSFGRMYMGKLSWSPDGGRISDIHVPEYARRNGVATAMYNHAMNLGVGVPEHSEQRTDEGEAWARSLGEELPERDPYFR